MTKQARKFGTSKAKQSNNQTQADFKVMSDNEWKHEQTSNNRKK